MKRFNDPINGVVKRLLVCGCTLALGTGSLFAQPYTGDLADLANGGTLGIDNLTFSGFSYQASGLTSFDPSAITVTASESGGVGYLTWTGNISLASAAAAGDLVLMYTVTANLGAISMIDQMYTGNATNGTILIDETATSLGAPTAYSQLSAGFGTPVVSQPDPYPNGPYTIGENENLSVAPAQSTLYVTKDISLTTSPSGGSITLTQVEQSFHPVPEPNTMLLGSLGGGLLLLLGSRRQVKRG
jgi:hypothetical protein